MTGALQTGAVDVTLGQESDVRHFRLIATTAVLVAASATACSSGPAVVKDYLHGTWSCKTEDVTTVVTVGDGTFTIKETPRTPGDPHLAYASRATINGTWDMSFGDVTIKFKAGSYDGLNSFVASDAPAADSSAQSIDVTMPWQMHASEFSGEPGSVRVRSDKDAVRIVYTSSDNDETTTTCTKG
jgi:hypothetical protein